LLAQVAQEHRRGVDVVDGDVEEALDLVGVQVHGEHARDTHRLQQVGHDLGRDRHARLVLAVLPGVAVIRNDRRDARRRRAAERVDHDHQLHQVLIDRPGRGRGSRLNDEHILAADVLVDLERHFSVGKAPQPSRPDGDA